MYTNVLSLPGCFADWEVVLDDPKAGFLTWHCSAGQLKFGMPLFPVEAVGMIAGGSIVVRTGPVVTEDVTHPVLAAVMEAIAAGTPVGVGLRPMKAKPQMYQFVVASTTQKKLNSILWRAVEIHDRLYDD